MLESSWAVAPCGAAVIRLTPAPYFFSGCFAAQPASDRNIADTSRIAANAYSVCPNGSTDSPSALSTIVAASGRVGSRKNVRPSSGLGANPIEPDTIESMIASPRARAVASTAAAMIAGRTARTEIVHITRQRFTPRAAAPSVHERGTERSASTMIAIMIGVIITVRIRTATIRLLPVSCTT